MTPVDMIVNLIFFAFILVVLFIWGRVIQRWEVKVAKDDGVTIRYFSASIEGSVPIDGVNWYIVKYTGDDKRTHYTLIPDQPGYQRLMRFWLGIVKAIVFRVDANDLPVPWSIDVTPAVAGDKLLHIKTHEMIINSLRTRILLDKYMLYIIVIIVAVVVLAGIVVWRVTSMPHETVIQIVNQTSKPEIPGVKP